MKVKKMKVCIIAGVRHFQGGNTYHRTRCTIQANNGKWVDICNTSERYGYGDAWQQTAATFLQANGYLPQGTYNLSRYCRENGIKFINMGVADVSTNKDLNSW
jgi:hypothetical protein